MLSIGWIAPLCLSHWLTQRLVSDAVIPAIRSGKVWVGSYDPLPHIDRLFYFSMAWLAAVIVGWSAYLTARNSR